MEAFLMILNFFRGAFVNFVNHELKMERKDAATVWCNTRDERCAKHAARVEKANHEVEHDGNCVEFKAIAHVVAKQTSFKLCFLRTTDLYWK